jgi:cell fate regulator YaaT (PSP1 superfamily)
MSSPSDQDNDKSVDDGWGDDDGSSSEGGDSNTDDAATLATGVEGAARKRKRRRRRRGQSGEDTGVVSDGDAAVRASDDDAPGQDRLVANDSPAGETAARAVGSSTSSRREARQSLNQVANDPANDQTRRSGQGAQSNEQRRPVQRGQSAQQSRPPRERLPSGREQRESVNDRAGGRGKPQASRSDSGAAGSADKRNLAAPTVPPVEEDDIVERSDPTGADGEPTEGSTAAANGPWGVDDDSPPKDIALAADLPMESSTETQTVVRVDLSGSVAHVVGVAFSAQGRVSWFDSGALSLSVGDIVNVDSERGPRRATVTVAPKRRVVRDRNLQRVIGLATTQDDKREEQSLEAAVHALRVAKDKANALRLPIKVFRCEYSAPPDRGGRLFIYFTSDERIDVREFLRGMTAATNARVELRQLGVRDEAKAVGGIGSCGLTLCCTTWMPDFVPVSIKMAKDQGLVLNPSKVSGQCGRLKCCLVYEQAGYAEMRKGLPKLGKRVVSARGEGRVVEVDVLRQRLRVSYGPGESEVLPAAEVKSLFPSGGSPGSTRQRGGNEPNDDDDGDSDDDNAHPGMKA